MRRFSDAIQYGWCRDISVKIDSTATASLATLAMDDRMLAAGVFDPAEQHPLELIGGEPHTMSTIGDRHADAVAFLTRWSSQHADASRMLVWVQNPLAIPGSESAPQPDVAWVTLRRYADRRPLSEEVSLLIEVADASLEFDATAKADLYAAAGGRNFGVCHGDETG